jgi:prepilin-type N-terminal cleavage/methylation domain-containing protein
VRARRRPACGGENGLTLIELLIALTILAALGTSMSVLLVGTLKAQRLSAQQDDLVQMARLAMERMVAHARQANRVLIPLQSNPTRTILALGGFIDNDGDGRYDEDSSNQLTPDGVPGIVGIDDDGDGSVDEGANNDDDEDGLKDEDDLNGLDDDGDGAIDEDPPNNDDEDGLNDEDPVEPVVYYLDAATKTLRERYPLNATMAVTTVLAEQVDAFQVQRLTGANGAVLINILLRLMAATGQVVELQTQVFPANLGK